MNQKPKSQDKPYWINGIFFLDGYGWTHAADGRLVCIDTEENILKEEIRNANNKTNH